MAVAEAGEAISAVRDALYVSTDKGREEGGSAAVATGADHLKTRVFAQADLRACESGRPE